MDNRKKEIDITHISETMSKTCLWFLILGLLWQGLELLIYGQIQPRIVDSIMSLLFLPFIYKAVKH